MSGPVTALVVDDEEMNRVIVAGHLSRLGYTTIDAADGDEAWKILKSRRHDIHVILLDRRMPGIDGMAFMELLRADRELAQIPVIMQTIADSSCEVAEAIQAGVFYYLTKPYDGELLRSVAAAAVEDYTRLKRLEGDVRSHADAMGLLVSGCFRFRTPRDAHNLAITLAAASPNARKLTFGLMELLMNAVEHGNLGIGFATKSRLKASGMLRREIEARLSLAANRDKHAIVRVERDAGRVTYTITDQGRGFDWRSYLEMNPARAQDAHGRGIALARTVSFDTLEYLGCGNTVVGTVEIAKHSGG
jgi:CheY-like chemotaxis protein/anti-sigma regulatory factor (Ser/Thr protein kinase)